MLLKRFVRERGGSVFPIFAIAIVPVTTIAKDLANLRVSR